MCIAQVARVLTVHPERGDALIETDVGVAIVSLAPIILEGGCVQPGDTILVHTGLAVAVLDAHEADELRAAIAALTAPGGPEP